MKYLALTRNFAEWLLPKVGLIATFYNALDSLRHNGKKTQGFEFNQDAIHISYDANAEICAIWHADYLSGTGSEDWGFVRFSGESSLGSEPAIAREVFERCLYVINQRLQGLLLDGSVIHRVWDNQAHTLLAGRGSVAHQLSIGYFEGIQGDGTLQNRSCVIVGPELAFQKLRELAFDEGRNLNRLTAAANSMLNARSTDKLPAADNVFPELRDAIKGFFETSHQISLFGHVEIKAESDVSPQNHSRYLALSYEEWIHPDSPLGDAKRRILSSANIDAQPLRILGPGGSGKTLLMLLLAVNKLKRASDSKSKILYIAHSKAMEKRVQERFEILLDSDFARLRNRLVVTTLAEYCRSQLGLDMQTVLDTDGDAAKEFQLDRVSEALDRVGKADAARIGKSKLLEQIFLDQHLLKLFSQLVLVEISVAIKGHGLENDKKRYVESEKSLSILHANLSAHEREFIFDSFLAYHQVVFEEYSALDPDDIAISLAGRLRTPVWQLRRKQEGFDYVFVDEAQLFNENERRLFPLLTKSEIPHVPIALALDQAQATYGQSSAGLSTLGIKGIANENLLSIHRSTESIARLAFFVIQKSTELFGPDFPDFTNLAQVMVPDSHPLAAKPVIEMQNPESPDVGRFVLKRVRELRKVNTRQIAIICYSDAYWGQVESYLSQADLPFQVISERGAKFPHDQPLVSLVKPAFVGGQEFDAVILVGLESGMVPPAIIDNLAMANAVEQQAIRDMYLGITRAKYRLMVVVAKGNLPNKIISQAKEAGLIA